MADPDSHGKMAKRSGGNGDIINGCGGSSIIWWADSLVLGLVIHFELHIFYVPTITSASVFVP